MLVHCRRDVLKAGAIIAHQHDERWDGSGYPRKLKGPDIRIYGRTAGLADVFDALSWECICRPAWPDEQIFGYIRQARETHFDPVLVDIFRSQLDAFLELRSQLLEPAGSWMHALARAG